MQVSRFGALRASDGVDFSFVGGLALIYVPVGAHRVGLSPTNAGHRMIPRDLHGTNRRVHIYRCTAAIGGGN